MCLVLWQENKYQYLQSVLSNPTISSIMSCLSIHRGVAYYLQNNKAHPIHTWATSHPHWSLHHFCNMQNRSKWFRKPPFFFFLGYCAPGSPIILNTNRVFLEQQPALIIEALWSCWEKRQDIFSWSYAVREEDGTHLHPQLLLCCKRRGFFYSAGSTSPTKNCWPNNRYKLNAYIYIQNQSFDLVNILF